MIDAKAAVKKCIDKIDEISKKKPKMNFYEQVLQGHFDMSMLKDFETKEKNELKDKALDTSRSEQMQAIILTTMASKADKFDSDLDDLGQNTVVGEQLIKYFRQDFCIYLTKTMFTQMTNLTIEVSKNLSSQDDISVY